MKVLHLFSDWKWTGPAEPALSLCEHLENEGVSVTLAYRKTPIDFPERTVGKEARKRTIRLHEGLRLNRYFSIFDWAHDFTSLASYVAKERFDIVHTHLSHDFFTAVVALSFSKGRPLIVRTDHKRDGLPTNRFMSWAMSRTDGLVTYSARIADFDRENFNFPQERIGVVPFGIKPYEGPVEDMRASLGIAYNEIVIGVIGRLKPDRGYDIVLRAFNILRSHLEGIRLIIVGRSSQVEESVMKPLRELGIEQDVVLAGYRVEDYFSVISTFDIFVMMRAGSDGSARALREVLGMGVPAVVSNKGMLPDLVDNGRTGYVVSWDANDLAGKIELLVTDVATRKGFGENAREKALKEWSYHSQAKAMVKFYESLVRMGKRR